MKTIARIMIFVIGLTSLSYSQTKDDDFDDDETIKIEDLPAVVIKSAGKDFSIYLPDRNSDRSVRQLEDKFIYYRLGKDYEGYDEYLVILEGDKGSLSATYNENGKLIHVIEKYDNVKLPSKVIYSVYKTFPNWEIIKDKYLYTQKEGDIIKKQYHLKIKKGNKTRQITVHADGTIIKGI